MAYEKITAYRLDDGTITDSLEKAEEHDKRSAFYAKIKEIYRNSGTYIESSEDFASIIWENKDKIKEALK